MPHQLNQIKLRIPVFSGGQPGVTKTAQWTNNTGAPIYVVGGWCWVGCAMDATGDVAFKVHNLSNGQEYVVDNWDHYANPTGAQDTLSPFHGMGDNYYIINSGDVIEFLLVCTGPYSDTSITVQGTAWINYVTIQP